MQEVEGNMTQFREQDYPIDSFIMVRLRCSSFTGRAFGSSRHVIFAIPTLFILYAGRTTTGLDQTLAARRELRATIAVVTLATRAGEAYLLAPHTPHLLHFLVLHFPVLLLTVPIQLLGQPDISGPQWDCHDAHGRRRAQALSRGSAHAVWRHPQAAHLLQPGSQQVQRLAPSRRRRRRCGKQQLELHRRQRMCHWRSGPGSALEL